MTTTLSLDLLQLDRLDDLAADLRDLALERAHPRLAGVVAHDAAHRRLGDFDLAVLDAVVLHLLGQQVAQRDVELLVLGVARQPDDFHPVEQRRRDVHRVRSRDEHRVRQVEVDLDVVVAEGVVLLRVEDLQQRGRRIAAEVHAELVDLVEQEQRVLGPDLGQALQHLARHRADVGAAVATDLGLVAHAAERHAHELAPGRARHALAERGLADARRPDEAQDRRLDLVDALLHREVLEDAVLDLVQPVVVLVEHLLGEGEVVLDLGLLRPRQVDQRVDVVAHDGGLGRHRRHQLQLLEFGVDLLLRLLRHLRGNDLLLELLHVGALFAVAELLLDRLDLLVQVVLALALFHLALDAATNALLDLEDVDLVLELLEQLLEPLVDGERGRARPACSRA